MGNKFGHVEIRCRNLERAKEFYGSLFSWQFTDFPQERFSVIDTGDETSGDLQEVKEGKPVGVTAFIYVDTIDEWLRNIETQGGKTIMGRTPIPGYGWWALFADRDDNVLALYEEPTN